MVDSYGGNLLASRAIYPSRYYPYLILLIVTKILYCFALYLSYDVTKVLHIVHFVFFIKVGSSILLTFLQKPFSVGGRLPKQIWIRIGRHAVVGSLLSVFWIFGLTLCGPLRTLLLYEHSDLVVIAGASALFTHSSTPSKFRGAVFFLLAVLGTFLFDHDDLEHHKNDQFGTHQHTSLLSHMFEHLTSLTGVSDHKGGVILLFVTLCINVGYSSASKKLSVDVGGTKRLHALSTLCSAVLLLPWALFVFFTRESLLMSSWSVVFPLLIITIIFVLNYYVDAVCVTRLDQSRSSRFGAMATFVAALALNFLWNHPFVNHLTSIAHLDKVITIDHVFSGGVAFSFVLFMFATNILSTPIRGGSRGSFIGYSAAGLPLYSFTGDTLHRTSHSMMLIAKNGLRQILEESDSRRIFYFLCINLSFTFVELAYGVWTNSLGLISDGFHMLFDCSALVMGLYAAIMSHWKPTRIFSYGFDRVEILSGFMNGVFLHVLADTLGSVGVIVSTLLIENFGWKIADPLCSVFIAFLIFISVIPLVKETSLILLLRTPEELQKHLAVTLRKVTSLFKEIGVGNITVQVEKEAFFQHMSGLGVSMNQVYEMTKKIKGLNYDHTAMFIKAI
ncbi:hypothetical protein LSH36_291g03057 [Paralvinella palmiformis]|uniref:Proton-coupled zinc antiporter SLC30A5 n=1 Tax=Paralvinella palmiformis TaxID=53620 RepID=A0AAD9JJ07_9ANNE|nr:hypothetical protein LSH36_291g03057 [Paralvinella palmiformis]